MSDYVIDVTEDLPERKSPISAICWGFCLGSLGMAIYLQTWRDILVSAMFSIIVSLVWPGGPGFWFGQAVCAAYGALRVLQDNARIDAASRADAEAPQGHRLDTSKGRTYAPPADWRRPPVVAAWEDFSASPLTAETITPTEPEPSPVVSAEAAPSVTEREPASPASVTVEPEMLPEPPAPAPVELPAGESEPAPTPPAPPAPKKRGRPRKLAA